MNGIRKWLSLALLLAFAVFTLPAVAAKGGSGNGTDKAYSLLVQAQPTYAGTPATIQTPVQVQAFLKNLAPPSTASSNVGSWELLITNPGVVFFVDATHQPSGKTSGVVNGTVSKTSDTRLLITGMAPLKGTDTYVLTFWVTSCGDARYDATVHTGSSLNGDLFNRQNDAADLSNLTTLISCGNLACGDTATLVADEAALTPDVNVVHGVFNKDGSTCGASSFFVSNKLLQSNGQVHFRWPVTGGGSAAVFAYSVTSTNAAPPKAGWLYSDGSGLATDAITNKTVAYIDVPTCMLTNGSAGILPAPYGALSQNANPNTTQIKVNTSPQNAVLPVPSGEFDIVVGSERMHVLSVQGSTWNVARGQGGTGNVSHPSGAPVMSTLLPLIASAAPATLADGTAVTIPSGRLAPYPYDLAPTGIGLQAQMCIVGSPVDNGNGTWSSTIVDINDGWVRIGQ